MRKRRQVSGRVVSASKQKARTRTSFVVSDVLQRHPVIPAGTFRKQATNYLSHFEIELT